MEKLEQAAKPMEAQKPKSRTMLYAIIIIILVVVGVAVYYLTRPPAGPSGPQVAIQDDGACPPAGDASCLFSPSSINANASGAAVVWTNNGKVGHTIATCDASNSPPSNACTPPLQTNLDSFISTTIAANSQFSHVFSKTGTYYYYCSIHPYMHGTVVVR